MNNYYKPLPKGARIALKERQTCNSIEEIAKKTGYSPRTVYSYLQKYGEKDIEKEQRAARIIEQLKQGKQQSKIALRNGVSRQYVSRLKKKLLKGEKND